MASNMEKILLTDIDRWGLWETVYILLYKEIGIHDGFTIKWLKYDNILKYLTERYENHNKNRPQNQQQ